MELVEEHGFVFVCWLFAKAIWLFQPVQQQQQQSFWSPSAVAGESIFGINSVRNIKKSKMLQRVAAVHVRFAHTGLDCTARSPFEYIYNLTLLM